MGCGQVGRRILEVLISEFRLYNTRETLKRVNIPLLASKLRRSQASWISNLLSWTITRISPTEIKDVPIEGR